MRRVRNSLYVLLAGFLTSGMLVACGGDSGTNGGGNGNGNDNGPCTGGACVQDTTIVTGQIETVFPVSPTLRLTGTSPLPGMTAAQPMPDSAVAGLPGEDGQIPQTYSGPATADSYTIPQVAPARRRLVVGILDQEDTFIGRVLLQDSTTSGAVVVTEPVNGETTLEAAVYQGLILGNQRVPEGLYNPPQVSLVHRFTADVADQVAQDRDEIEALRDAYEPAQETLVRGYVALTDGYDSLTVNAGVRAHAQAYAEARDGGTAAADAHPDFVQGAVDTHIEIAGSPMQVATIWGTWGTLHDDVLAGMTTLTRLQSAQNILHISVTARQALVAEVADGTDGKDEVSAALDDVLAAGMGATDMAGFMSAVSAAVSDGADALETARGADLTDELSAADLGAFVDPTMSPAEIALSLPDYVSGVEDAAGDADLAALLVALMGGPAYSGG